MFWGVFYRKTGLLEKIVIARGTSKHQSIYSHQNPLEGISKPGDCFAVTDNDIIGFGC